MGDGQCGMLSMQRCMHRKLCFNKKRALVERFELLDDQMLSTH